MKVTFVLPIYARVPVGGHKVVYEYANRLTSRGHEVAVVHARSCTPKITLPARLEASAWNLRNRLLDHPLVPWFSVDSRVRRLFTPGLQSHRLPDADVLIATSWHTARWVAEAPASKGGKLYLIQHHETWCGEAEEVNATWTLPLHKIVVSKWLHEIAVSFGQGDRTTFIPCGLDFDRFRITRPMEGRPARVGMMYHPSDWKGSPDGVAALEVVRSQRPDVTAVLFGITDRPEELPSWMEYVRRPGPDQHRELYNSCGTFLQPSWSEGWGLPATEAMTCGCALVTTDNGGSGTYAFHDETALVAPARDPFQLAEHMLRLVREPELRLRIARSGNRYVQQFTWDSAVDQIERVFQSVVDAFPLASAATQDRRDGKP
jgi:glycosyltransferase involved in cell wall biosynthesis